MSTKQSTKKTTTTASSKKTTPPAAPSKKAPSKKVVEEEEVDVDDSSMELRERKRREVSKDTIDGDFNVLQDRVEGEISRLRESTEKVRGIKFLRSINKALKTLHSDTKRVLKLKKKNNRKKTVVSGFLKPIKISSQLATFTGWDVNGTYSRVNVTKYICDYIKDNHLFNENDKRLILVDDKLKALLNYDPAHPPKDKDGNSAPLNYFRLQRYLKPHFIKLDSKDAPVEQPATPVATKSSKTGGKASTAASAKPSAKKPARRVVEEEDDDLEDDE